MRYLLLLLFCGCSVTEIVTPRDSFPADTVVTGLDFRPFAQQGFLFTTEVYTGEYDGIGIINIQMYPPATRSQQELDSADNSETQRAWEDWTEGEVSTSELLQRAFDEARQMGADAIINLRVERVTRTDVAAAIQYTGGTSVETFERSGLQVSGFAIRRR